MLNAFYFDTVKLYFYLLFLFFCLTLIFSLLSVLQPGPQSPSSCSFWTFHRCCPSWTGLSWSCRTVLSHCWRVTNDDWWITLMANRKFICRSLFIQLHVWIKVSWFPLSHLCLICHVGYNNYFIHAYIVVANAGTYKPILSHFIF